MSSSPSPPFRVALAQTSPFNAPSTPDSKNLLQTVENNLLDIARYAKRAKDGGADVVVFPEYFVGGLVEGKEYVVHPAPHALAYLQALCKSLHICLIGTLVEPQLLPSPSVTGEPTASPFAHLPLLGDESVETPAANEQVRKEWRTFLEGRYPHCFSPGANVGEELSANEKEARLSESPDQKDVPSSSTVPTLPNAQEIISDPSTLLSTASDLAHLALSAAKDAIVSLSGSDSAGTSRDQGERPLSMSNTAYFIDSEGEIRGKYRKKNLWIPERDYLVAGEEDHAVFDTPFGKAGLLICWDLSRPQAAGKLAHRGADIIFAPTYWMGFDSEPGIKLHSPPKDYERDLLRSLAYTRAFETETAVIMVNPGTSKSSTSSDGDGFIGGSGAWLPFKGLHGQVQRGGDGIDCEGLSFVDIDLKVLHASRNTYQIRQDKVGMIGSM